MKGWPALLLLLGVLASGNGFAATGRLVIVGGALRASNDAVFEAFLKGNPDRRIGIVPAASSKPAESAEKFRQQLVQRGVPRAQVEVLPLALRDDPSTKAVDESSWQEKGQCEELAERILELDAVWFTGGDQERIVRVLRGGQKGPTPVLAAIRQVFARGGTIGGTSAGAAIQSDTMILGGTSAEALAHGLSSDYEGMQAQESGALVLDSGFGWFPHGTIDQHFDRKGRLGRLVVALSQAEAGSRVGFGIDEDTALVYDAETQTGFVAGAGSVCVVDLRPAKIQARSWENIRLSVLTSGDRLRWPGPALEVASTKAPTAGAEYMQIPSPEVSGPLSPYGGRLEDILGFLLLDNADATSVASSVQASDGTRFRLEFRQEDDSAGYWATLDGEFVRYSTLGARLDIRPSTRRR